MKISKKSELVELLRIFQNQITTIKTTIDNLIKKAINSENEISELENSEIIQESNSTSTVKRDKQNSVSPAKTTKEIAKENFEDISLQGEPELTALPPKPESLKKDEAELEESLKPPPKLKTKAKNKKELKNEKEGLETKLTSVQDLLKFIDKKHSSGSLDDNEFAKRSKKLQSDIKKTKKRIDIINKLLEK